MKNTKVIGVIIALVVLAALAWFFTKSSEQQVSQLDIIDTVGEFYGDWLLAAKDPATRDPSKATLAESPILSKALRERLISAVKNSEASPDPVLCQTKVPESVTTRTVYEREENAQVLVTSRDKSVTEQAIFTLIKHNEGWYIDDIQCRAGEFAPEREFSFEKEGFLIKDSIPAPYNSKNWHLVFEEDGTPGTVAPLFFDKESQCTGLDGVTSVCKTEQFTETTKVSVRGQMSERGVSVKRLGFIK